MASARRLMAVEIRGEQDVVLAQQRARQIGGLLGFDQLARTKLGTSVSEIVRNALQYAGGGRIAFAFAEGDPRRLIIEVSDSGQGIANLEAILEGRYTSRTGMGMGLLGTRRIMDQFTVVCQPRKGTVVTLVKFLSPLAPAITGESMQRIAQTLALGIPGNPVTEIQQQNQDLLRVLDELQTRQQDLVAVNRELEDTNRGVVALYSELDASADFLKKSTEVKSKFLSHMTHELRTPLNSIIALSNMLIQRSDGELTSEQDKQVGFILRSAQTLSELVNDLLDTAKVEAGKVAIRPLAFTIGSLFGSKGLLKPLLATNSSVTLEFDEPPPGIQPLFTDEGKVSQILRNLISNALKFTHRGQVRVGVAPAAHGRIGFSVSDTGDGIAPENVPTIFEAFGQLDTGLAKVFIGTGLGLPLSKRLAELLGGSLAVTSTLGQGSVFTLDIPTHYAGEDHGTIVDATPGDRGSPFRRQALIIDDDEVSRYLLKGILPAVFEVVEAATGSDGIDMAKRLEPDVIFLDLNMPGMSGIEVLSELRRHPALARVPIVVYSAQPVDEATSATVAAGDAIVLISKKDVESAKETLLRTLRQINLVPDALEHRND